MLGDRLHCGIGTAARDIPLLGRLDQGPPPRARVHDQGRDCRPCRWILLQSPDQGVEQGAVEAVGASASLHTGYILG